MNKRRVCNHVIIIGVMYKTTEAVFIFLAETTRQVNPCSDAATHKLFSQLLIDKCSVHWQAERQVNHLHTQSSPIKSLIDELFEGNK